ncbi:MAG: hypothetical protein H7122_08450 [Chitinophagaceae bacterium]|nr:hypothetical protein [Chitinophagaceae bacterium]
MKGIYSLYVLSVLTCIYSCNQFVYLPKSAKQKYFARPKVQFMMAVVNFRELRGNWPPSLNELGLYSIENRKIIKDFQYQTADFVIKNNDKLYVYFDNYKKELYLDDPDRTDLNRFHGRIIFYKSKDTFVWKVKM